MGVLAKVITEMNCNEKEARLICLDLIASAVTFPYWNPDPVAVIKEHLTDYASAFPGDVSISMKAEQWVAKKPQLKLVGGKDA